MTTFSIITVCLNAQAQIADTIISVLNQTNTDFEYIIKDGGSGDRTLEIVDSFAPAFAEKGISYRVISQSDRGIYDAMNQAAQEVQGEWVIFMNAGDQFADSYVLSMVKESGCLETADIVYGDRIDCADAGYFYRKALPLERMRDRQPFCHQSVFAKKYLYNEMQYSLQYRICSDYLFFLHWYREGKRFAYIPFAISIFDRHGMSSNGKETARELLMIQENMPIPDEEIIQMLRREIADYDKKPPVYRRVISQLMPNSIRERRWQRIRKAKGWKTKDEFFAEKEKNGGHVNKHI